MNLAEYATYDALGLAELVGHVCPTFTAILSIAFSSARRSSTAWFSSRPIRRSWDTLSEPLGERCLRTVSRPKNRFAARKQVPTSEKIYC